MNITKVSRFAVVALLAGSLQAKADDSLVPMKRAEAIAACTTLAEKIQANTSADRVSQAKKLVQLCDEGLAAIYESLRLQSDENFLAGLGLFLSLEGNTPSIRHVALGTRVAVGGSAFMTSTPDLRFTPMVNVSPVTVQGTWKGSPSLIEPQIGLVVYIGSKNTKSINQLNGLYAGVGAELPNFFSSTQQNRSSLTFNILRNVRGNHAIVALKSFNAGSDMVAANVQVMSVNNVTRTGEGTASSGLFKGIGTEFADIVASAADSVVNLVKRPFVRE